MRVYVASSWRNERQPWIVAALREAGHEVYDFRNPAEGNSGFGWKDADLTYKHGDGLAPDRFLSVLHHAAAGEGFALDFEAMKWADAFVMVLPCGKSAHLELGWATGAGKRTVILLAEENEPELMYKLANRICTRVEDVVAALVCVPTDTTLKTIVAARRPHLDANGNILSRGELEALVEELMAALRALVDALPRCDDCAAPATKAWARGGARKCDAHAADMPDYPRAASLRTSQALLARLGATVAK